MAYIGSGPENKGIGLFSQDTFTGDGSTTTFDLTEVAPDGGGNDIQVFVDNVRQQEGSSNAYTLGLDGSSDLKRITFTTAPAASQSIFVLNPGTKNTQSIQSISDNTVSSAKIQSNAVTTAKITDANVTRAKLEADIIDATKLADDAVSEEHVDVTALTGHTELAAKAANDDVFVMFDTSANVLKKIQRSNLVVSQPTITSVSPTNVNEGDGTGNHTFVITGTNFTGGSANLINASGSTVNFDTTTVNSATQITGVIAKSSLPGSGEPYDVKVSSTDGLSQTLTDQININQSPTFVTAAGSLGSVADGSAEGNFTIVAVDPESAGNVTFEKKSGTFPPGMSVSTVHEDGVSKFKISGNPTDVSNNTTFSFDLKAIDAASNTSTRTFTISVVAPVFEVFNSSGTFTVPTGVTQVDALVVGGGGHGGYQHAGGGGAGGLIFMPNFPVTPGGTIAVTVGCGGTPSGGSSPGFPNMTGQDSAFGAPGNPGLGPSGSFLTAKGGGVGQSGCSAAPNGDGPGTAGSGGSGGGAGYQSSNNGGGAATQPTQPGNSGAYGFGNQGGDVTGTGGNRGGGGGGGAGAAGANSPNASGGNGGVGKAYTIADGTTPVFYAGGGGGSNHASPSTAGTGGQGGGGNAGVGPKGQNGAPPRQSPDAQAGQANKGGGGGAAHYAGQQSNFSCAPQGINQGIGGKGVVIVRWS